LKTIIVNTSDLVCSGFGHAPWTCNGVAGRTNQTTMPERVVAVIYVDQDGRERPARTVGYPLPGQAVWLVVGGGGIGLRRAHYSDEAVPDTWHYPADPR